MIKLRCYKPAWSDAIDFAILEKGEGFLAVADPITMRTVDQSHIIEPTFRLRQEQAQELIDELWACGLRPSEGAGSAGSLAATERHLSDMQKIAFGMLKKNDLVP